MSSWSAPFAGWVFKNWEDLSRKVDGKRIAAEVKQNLRAAAVSAGLAEGPQRPLKAPGKPAANKPAVRKAAAKKATVSRKPAAKKAMARRPARRGTEKKAADRAAAVHA